MVIGASPGAVWLSGIEDGVDGVEDSVVVSILFLCVVVLRPRHRRPKPAITAGTHGHLFGRVVFVGVAVLNEAGGFYHKSELSSFQPREFRAPTLQLMVTV